MSLKFHSILLIVICFTLCSFKKTVFKRGKKYYYESVYIQPNGDTLAVENFTWKPRGLPWLLQPFVQTSVIFRYYPDSAKTMNLVPIKEYRKKIREEKLQEYEEKGKEWKGEWMVRSDMGAIENKEELWIHPIRNDHFAYTEIAPFPYVEKEKLRKDSTWKYTKLFSINNFSGESKELYTVIGKKDYLYKNFKLTDCWQINAVGIHNDLGENRLSFLYHPEHGFIEMKYEFFNGIKIAFFMTKVVNKKSK